MNQRLFSLGKITLLFVALSAFISSCGLIYSEVELYGVKSAHVKRVTSKFVELDLMVEISNPNKYEIRIVDSDLEAYADSMRIGNASIIKEIIIPSESSGEYHCPVRATFDAAFANNLGAFVRLALNGPVEIDVKGEISGKALFLTKTIDIDIREEFEF